MNHRSIATRGALGLAAACAVALIPLTSAPAAAGPPLGDDTSPETLQELATPAVPTPSAVADAVPVVADATPTGTQDDLILQSADEVGVQATLGYPLPYLSTVFGPVAQGTVVDGGSGAPGFYSPLTGEFAASAGAVPVVEARWYSWNSGSILGYASLETPFGPGVWATQYSGAFARWGIVNLLTSTFNPADTGWQPTV